MISDKVWKQTDLSFYINDKKLSGVYEFGISDIEKKTYITISRYVVDGSEGLVNEMRANNFSVKLVNKATHNGYSSDVASLYSFEMGMKVDSNGDQLLRQVIVVIAANFIYTDKQTEEEDTAKLIQVLKEERAKKSNIPTAVIEAKKLFGDAGQKEIIELALKNVSKYAKIIEEVSGVSRSRPPVEVSDKDLTWSNVRKPEEVADYVPTRKLESKPKKQ